MMITQQRTAGRTATPIPALGTALHKLATDYPDSADVMLCESSEGVAQPIEGRVIPDTWYLVITRPQLGRLMTLHGYDPRCLASRRWQRELAELVRRTADTR